MNRKFLILALIILIFSIVGCIQIKNQIKSGIYCSNSIEGFWSYENILNYTPEQFKDIVKNGNVQECVNYDLLNQEPRAVCEACGWICALDSPYFLRYTKNETILEVYLWDVQCMGNGLEFRLKGQGIKEGEKIILTEKKSSLPNPAAVFCKEQGNSYEIREDWKGNQYGVCILENGTECDEWAYYRGGCESCLTYCPKQQHIMCVGHWNISGEYPNCTCSWICETE